jgi:alkanesulfonate monooxygenase SsuD/methylene tetrahydromethanopterin reductase-like flavin-dependent oxidoreductase (luciferase family)
MRIGINMPFVREDGEPLSAKDIMTRAVAIEKAGFDGIWIGDAIGRMRLTRPDPFLWLLPAAAATERIEVGTAILQLPLRNPVELAQRFVTIQALTRGRFTVGVGSGSTKEDFDACGVDYEKRFKIFGESLSIIRRLCRGEVVGTADLNPWQTNQGGPPILIGAWANGRWLKRCAEEYDGWIASGGRTNFVTLREGIKRYRDMGGGRAIVATVPVDLSAESSELDEHGPFNLRCGPEEASARLHRLAELGYDDVLLYRVRSSREQARAPGRSHYEADLDEENLAQIRSVFPAHNRRP